jgi:hypothetical protein
MKFQHTIKEFDSTIREMGPNPMNEE